MIKGSPMKIPKISALNWYDNKIRKILKKMIIMDESLELFVWVWLLTFKLRLGNVCFFEDISTILYLLIRDFRLCN